MKHIIQFKIYKGEKYYIGESIDLPIITRGRTIDEVVSNIKEALSLHLESEDFSKLDLSKNSSILLNLELEPIYA
ncbi:MAG: type II toxin-antitoxin system HicB family antitoxin [Parcubacteria group bacterium]|nr:type II toxin-antitoxin system HicB family antitoxin [Parcubacteria group bacterium]